MVKSMQSSITFFIWLFLVSLAVVANAQEKTVVPSLYIIGDSTAANSRYLGWENHLAKYFNDAKLQVINRARGGRSSRTFDAEGYGTMYGQT